MSSTSSSVLYNSIGSTAAPNFDGSEQFGVNARQAPPAAAAPPMPPPTRRARARAQPAGVRQRWDSMAGRAGRDRGRYHGLGQDKNYSRRIKSGEGKRTHRGDGLPPGQRHKGTPHQDVLPPEAVSLTSPPKGYLEPQGPEEPRCYLPTNCTLSKLEGRMGPRMT